MQTSRDSGELLVNGPERLILGLACALALPIKVALQNIPEHSKPSQWLGFLNKECGMRTYGACESTQFQARPKPQMA